MVRSHMLRYQSVHRMMLFCLTIPGCFGRTDHMCRGTTISSMANSHSQENLLQIYHNIKSKSECSLQCLSDKWCKLAYFHETDKVCQTHFSIMPIDSLTTHPGGIFFMMECNDRCPENIGYIPKPSLSMCYKISSKQKTWQDARNACIADGGDLVKVDSFKKHEFFKNIFVGNDDYFIGGSAEVVEGSWKWVDGVPTSGGYEAWGANEPNSIGGPQNCLALYYGKGYDWIDATCSWTWRYICQIIM